MLYASRWLLIASLLLLCGCTERGDAAGRRGDPASFSALERSPPLSSTVTLTAVGDILLDRGVAEKIDRHGTGYPFEQVAGILSAADITFGNLECPLTDKGTKVPKRYCFQAHPAAVACLVESGFDLLSLANNHTMDCGRTGLVETIQVLKNKGIKWCGAGGSRAEAEVATVLTVKGVKIAFIGFSEFLPEGSFVRVDRPTIAFASPERVRRAVKAARRTADVVVTSFHWGIEYAARPHPRQRRLTRAAMEAGADLVLGHHPHVLQGLEVITRASPPVRPPQLVAYSLGNFLFDRRTGRALQSAILRCSLTRHGLTAAEVVPIQLDGIRPLPATALQSQTILTRLAMLSAERNTRLTAGQVMLNIKSR
jgi:poly-gamma-glutamate capsule biosynthesis protein CapA/YwtB (metallophosphatase superfamily)